MSRIRIEVCVPGLSGAREAARGGADRLELCSGLPLGGLTPGVGQVTAVLQAISLPVVALVRPREGGFRYHDDDVETMMAEIEHLRELGVTGFAVGALSAEGALDESILGRLREAAADSDLCLHRAFDLVRDAGEALERAIALGFDRILTSGLAPSAPEGAATIAALIRAAGDRIEVMPGGGVTAANAGELLRTTGARSLHLSASRWIASEMRVEEGGVPLGAGFAADETRHLDTDAGLVRDLVRAIRVDPIDETDEER